jgi:hypothetical protein
MGMDHLEGHELVVLLGEEHGAHGAHSELLDEAVGPDAGDVERGAAYGCMVGC